MRVIAIYEGPNQVCYRYRIEPFAWAMAERGLHLEGMPLARSLAGRLAQFKSLRRAEMVIIQRKLLPLWQLALLRRHVRRLIYDFDDAVFQRDSNSTKGTHSITRSSRFWGMMLAADLVIAGNEYLRQSATDFAPAERVGVVPTCLEPKWYVLADHRRAAQRGETGEMRLGWIGQATTLKTLTKASDQLAAAATRLPGLRLRLICDRKANLPVAVELRPWSLLTETEELAAADIGISWLPDDSWSRGKCGLKVLQYMAAGLPVVANPVGMNSQLVIHGHTGFLASTPAQWAEAIGQLAASPGLRQQMGAAGRRMVQRDYSVATWGPKFAEMVQGERTNEVFGGTERRLADHAMLNRLQRHQQHGSDITATILPGARTTGDP